MPDNQGQQIQPGQAISLDIYERYFTNWQGICSIPQPPQPLEPQGMEASPEPIAYEAPRLNFQVGDIYSWNMNLEEVRRHIEMKDKLGKSIVKIEEIYIENLLAWRCLHSKHEYGFRSI
jgi:hypothetical protein